MKLIISYKKVVQREDRLWSWFDWASVVITDPRSFCLCAVPSSSVGLIQILTILSSSAQSKLQFSSISQKKQAAYFKQKRNILKEYLCRSQHHQDVWIAKASRVLSRTHHVLVRADPQPGLNIQYHSSHMCHTDSGLRQAL